MRGRKRTLRPTKPMWGAMRASRPLANTSLGSGRCECGKPIPAIIRNSKTRGSDRPRRFVCWVHARGLLSGPRAAEGAPHYWRSANGWRAGYGRFPASPVRASGTALGLVAFEHSSYPIPPGSAEFEGLETKRRIPNLDGAPACELTPVIKRFAFTVAFPNFLPDDLSAAVADANPIFLHLKFPLNWSSALIRSRFLLCSYAGRGFNGTRLHMFREHTEIWRYPHL